jgi:V8-like Glu-specific endopeptidase
MDSKAITLLELLIFVGCVYNVHSFSANDMPIEMEEDDKDLNEVPEGSIGAFDPNDLVYHYTKETINKNRKVTFDFKTGEPTYETDKEVEEILEMVRRDNFTSMYSSFSIPNNTHDSLNRSVRIERSRAYIRGRDDRYRITSTSSFPYCAIGQFYSGKGGYCTLFMVGPYHALTAAHCVYDRSSRRTYSDGHVYLRRSCYTRGTHVDVRQVLTYTQYTNNGDNAYDFACLLLDRNDVYTSCYMGFAYRDPMPTVSMTVCGYPCDKDELSYRCIYCGGCNDAKRQCTTSGWWWSRKTTCNDERIQYTCDVAGGMSGGPAYTLAHDSSSTRYAYGVHTHASTVSSLNFASRISKKKFKDTCLWLQRNGGVCNPSNPL